MEPVPPPKKNTTLQPLVRLFLRLVDTTVLNQFFFVIGHHWLTWADKFNRFCFEKLDVSYGNLRYSYHAYSVQKWIVTLKNKIIRSYHTLPKLANDNLSHSVHIKTYTRPCIYRENYKSKKSILKYPKMHLQFFHTQ